MNKIIDNYLLFLHEDWIIWAQNLKNNGNDYVEVNGKMLKDFDEKSYHIYKSNKNIGKKIKTVKLPNSTSFNLYIRGDKFHLSFNSSKNIDVVGRSAPFSIQGNLREIDQVPTRLKSFLNKIGWTCEYDELQKFIDEVKKESKLKSNMKKILPVLKNKKVIASTVLTLSIITLAYTIYKKMKKRNEEFCNKIQDSKKRENCIKLNKIKALKIRINILQKNLSKCIDSNEPEKCNNEIVKEIKKLQNRIKKIYYN